jgi:hypothetical protein
MADRRDGKTPCVVAGPGNSPDYCSCRLRNWLLRYVYDEQMRATILIAVLAVVPAGCALAPIELHPAGRVSASGVVVADARPGAPSSRVVGFWYGRSLTLPGDEDLRRMVAEAVGKSFPRARVRVDAFWIAPEENRFGAPIAGRMRLAVSNGARSTTLTSFNRLNAFNPQAGDFQKSLDGLLGDVAAMLEMMKYTGEL